MILLLTALSTSFVFASLSGAKIKVINDGSELGNKTKIYSIGNKEYFSIEELAKIYDCRLVWHQVTGKVSMLFNNEKMDFYIKSTKVVIDKKTMRLQTPNHLISGKLYVPADFVFSEHFADFTKTDSYWNPETKILTIDPRNNILPLRFYSGPRETRIIIELSEKLPYYFSDKNKGKITLDFKLARAAKEDIEVDDGVVKEIYVRSRGRQAFITVYLTEGAGRARESYFDNPKRIEVTIARTPLAEDKLISSICPMPAAEPIASSQTVKVPEIIEVVASSEPAQAQPLPAKKKETNGKTKTVVLDAGHGGDDPGAIGHNGTKEKDINLAIILELKRLFENDPDNGYNIVLSREDDTFIPLAERTSLANDRQADLFVSVHCNASMKETSRGFEIYFLNENASDPEAAATAVLENSVLKLEGKPTKKMEKLQQLLWSMVVNEFINESSEACCFVSQEVNKRVKIENRGVKQAGFYVLRGAQMPAVLVECAFLSNYEEEAKLRNKKYQQKMADAIYEGIKKYTLHKNNKIVKK